MPRRKISRVRNRSEVGSKNPHGWIAFEKGRGTRTIDERGKEKDARLLKSPFIVLESSLESQSTFVFDSLFAILHLRQYSLLQFAPSTICFVENSPSIGSLSLCSTNNRLLIRRSSLAKAFVEISTEGRYRFNRYRYRLPISRNIWKTSMKIIERKTIHGDGMGRGVYSGEVGRGWTITNGYTSVAEIGIMLWKETASFLSCAFGDSFEWKKPQVAECI